MYACFRHFLGTSIKCCNVRIMTWCIHVISKHTFHLSLMFEMSKLFHVCARYYLRRMHYSRLRTSLFGDACIIWMHIHSKVLLQGTYIISYDCAWIDTHLWFSCTYIIRRHMYCVMLNALVQGTPTILACMNYVTVRALLFPDICVHG